MVQENITAVSDKGYPLNLRVPVLDPKGNPIMPTTLKRARQWIKNNKAEPVKTGLGLFCVKLKIKPSGYTVQKISLGLDPGQKFTGIGVQSGKATLYAAHLELPHEKTIYKRRKKRNLITNNLMNKKLFELEIAKELIKLFPISKIIMEISDTKKDQSKWNSVILSEHWILGQLNLMVPSVFIDGTITAQIRKRMKLTKQKTSKGDEVPETQAVDGVALACYDFITNLKKKSYLIDCWLSCGPFAVLSNQNKKRNKVVNFTKIIRYVDFDEVLRS